MNPVNSKGLFIYFVLQFAGQISCLRSKLEFDEGDTLTMSPCLQSVSRRELFGQYSL